MGAPEDKRGVGNGAPSAAEFTFRALVLGAVIGVLFGAANSYVGLKVGLTVSASIPAAVMSVAVFRALRRTGLARPAGVLENNMVQTIGSAGESLAAGVIFTVPALILLGYSPGVLKIFILGSIGGVLGVLIMVPLRSYLIEREHGKLAYPEGTACASVLEAGREGGAGGGLVFAGLGAGALFEFVTGGLGLWRDKARATMESYQGAQVSADVSPALLGVGYVIGPRIAAVMFGGGALAWLVFIPMIKLFGGNNPAPVFPAAVPISELDAQGLWHNYIRYVGAGAVAFGGAVTLVRSLPLIFESGAAVFSSALGLGEGSGGPRSARIDIPGPWLIGGVLVCFLSMALLPRSVAPGGFLPALLALFFAVFFVAVSSRIVGIIGSSSNPVSGMTIAALLATALIFKLLGWIDSAGQAAALAVGSVVCIAAAVAGDSSQDLKTGYLVGATPWRQQAGELIGVLTSAAAIGWVVLMLHEGTGIGSEELPAPQATLMSLVVKGALSGDLPWSLVFVGAFAAAIVELVGLPSLPFAVGLYLPLSLTTPVLIGGLLRHGAERFAGKGGEDTDTSSGDGEGPAAFAKEVGSRGVLFSSGLIAGSAFVGLLFGLLRSFGADSSPAAFLRAIEVGPDWSGRFGDLVALAALLVLATALFVVGAGRGPGRRRS